MNGVSQLRKEPSSNSLDSFNVSTGCAKRSGSIERSPYRSEFQGKVIIVTGATRAIGRQISLSFGREGAFLALQGQSLDKLTNTKDALVRAGMDDRKVLLVVNSLSGEMEAQELVERTAHRFGKVDTLIINYEPAEAVVDCAESVNENIRNLVQLTSLAAKHLARTKGSVLALGSSIGSKCSPWRGISKGALDGWVRAMAQLQGPKGIRVNALLVGHIRSDFRTRQAALENAADEMSPACLNALRRCGTVEEVANVALFLASSRGSFITGQALTVDGGFAF